MNSKDNTCFYRLCFFYEVLINKVQSASVLNTCKKLYLIVSILFFSSLDFFAQTTFYKDYGVSNIASRETTTGDFIIVGRYWLSGDISLIKTDNAGTVIWSKTIGTALHDNPSCIQQTSDGGFIIVGGTERLHVVLKFCFFENNSDF